MPEWTSWTQWVRWDPRKSEAEGRGFTTRDELDVLTLTSSTGENGRQRDLTDRDLWHCSINLGGPKTEMDGQLDFILQKRWS